MAVVASAPGKLVLLGEYAVLEGAPALVAAVDRRVQVRVGLARGAAVRLEAPDLEVRAARGELDPFAALAWPGLDAATRERLVLAGAAIEAAAFAARAADRPWRPAAVHIASSALCLMPGGPKLGLGSSAAVTVAVLMALHAHLRLPLPETELLRLALAVHRRGQGGGSGIDVAASVRGGVLRFVRDAAREPELTLLAWPAELACLMVWSGRPAYTSGYLAAVRALAASAPVQHRALLDELGQLAGEGAAAFAAGELGRFLLVVNAYESAMARLGAAAGVDIVTAEHQRIGNLVRAEGGVYKPSGAGGGDLGVAFCRAAEAGELARALDRGGLARLPMTLAGAGARLDEDDERTD